MGVQGEVPGECHRCGGVVDAGVEGASVEVTGTRATAVLVAMS